MPKRHNYQNITEAGAALSDDLPSRQKRYFISMMIRTACFLLAVRETIRGKSAVLRSKQREIG